MDAKTESEQDLREVVKSAVSAGRVIVAPELETSDMVALLAELDRLRELERGARLAARMAPASMENRTSTEQRLLWELQQLGRARATGRDGA